MIPCSQQNDPYDFPMLHHLPIISNHIYIYIHDVHHVQSLFHNLPSIFSSCSHRFSHRFSLVMKSRPIDFEHVHVEPQHFLATKRALRFKLVKQLMAELNLPEDGDDPTRSHFCPRRDDVKTMPSDSWLVVSNMTFMGKSPFLMGKSTINGSTLKRTSCQTLG